MTLLCSPPPSGFFAVFQAEEAAGAVTKLYFGDHKVDPLSKIETLFAEGGELELIAAKSMLATHGNITRFEAELEARAVTHGGYLGGWSVLQERDGPRGLACRRCGQEIRYSGIQEGV